MDLMHVGIDIGSTTAKVVALNPDHEILFSAYRRHNAATLETLQYILKETKECLGNRDMDLLVTGSAGMGFSEKYDLPFVQEVVASAEVVRQMYPDVSTLIDIGGEDSKLIFFDHEGGPPVMRMNGACAGGTGAFIDQMAMLLNVTVSELNELAINHSQIYPIASRCGVFAKTDVQNLLSREISRQDIAASIFSAVAMQTITTLSRGRKPQANIVFCGGPLTFLSSLKNIFIKELNLAKDSVQKISNAELFPAIGAALTVSNRKKTSLNGFIDLLKSKPGNGSKSSYRLKPLFNGKKEYKEWESARSKNKVERANLCDLADDQPIFLGIDSGSTTSKIVLTDDSGRLIFEFYTQNRGNPLEAVRRGLLQIKELFAEQGRELSIARSAVTGYGEDLIQGAYGFDQVMVETLAHFRAAKHFEPGVSFILDIGGQDMKALFIKNSYIQNIEINEACSSGCGSFIQTFAESLGYNVADFAVSACSSQAPCDLGTRCTVFMNSKVKQSLREGASINDISAGLAYSVVKNALHKVLKITNTDVLGENIIVQGGTFRNPAVHKALENLLDRPVLCPDVAELMGAYGAALTARDTYNRLHKNGPVNGNGRSVFNFDRLEKVTDYEKRLIYCKGCENTCTITRLTFSNDNVFYTGNRCERIFNSKGKENQKGVNLLDQKLKMLFDRPMEPKLPAKMVIGIPRVLNMFENFPFWNTLFVESGITVRLSDPSNHRLFKKGMGTIMSENICFPAKLVHGHIYNLIDAGVDRIFYPMIVFESREFEDAINCYNCPIVSGYPEVIRSAIDPYRMHNTPFDMPAVNLADRKLLKRVCIDYLTDLGINKQTARHAFEQALKAQDDYKVDLKAASEKILTDARSQNRPVVMLMGRPYHIDSLINHKTPEMLADFGVDIITEDSLPAMDGQKLNNRHVMTQWAYPNRYYHAARWVAEQDNVQLVQLNSFGCGPDAMAVDEVKSILNEYGKSPTVIRIDEIDSTGSTRLRLRSMIESVALRDKMAESVYKSRKTNRLFFKEDSGRTILVPHFSFFNRSALVRPLVDMGYKIELLPAPDRQSVDVGLKYTNNEICYPAIILIGDLIKALQSGQYNLDNIAVLLTQTGGQCRASCYISLLKRAMDAARLTDVPIVSLSVGSRELHEQPGFNLNYIQYIRKAMLSMMYSDALAILYYSTASRECSKGEALNLADKYLKMMDNNEFALKKEVILNILSSAVKEFNAIKTEDTVLSKAGIMGEIYVKYNSFANNSVAEWLIEQKIEVVMAGLGQFFLSWIVDATEAVKSNVMRRNVLSRISSPLIKYINKLLDDTDKVLGLFKYYTPAHRIKDVAEKARQVLSLTHQYGEEWLVAGEIGMLAGQGVKNILCLQPFGCIANQVVAKGVERRLRELHPQLNLLFLDADAGVSEVNFQNRLHFFASHAKSAMC